MINKHGYRGLYVAYVSTEISYNARVGKMHKLNYLKMLFYFATSKYVSLPDSSETNIYKPSSYPPVSGKHIRARHTLTEPAMGRTANDLTTCTSHTHGCRKECVEGEGIDNSVVLD